MMAVLRTRDLTFPRRGGHFRHAGPHGEPLRCVRWCLLRRCALESSSGGDFGESAGSISDRRDDSNSQTEKEKSRINANGRNGAEAKHCTCTRADIGCGKSASTNRPGGREKARTQSEHCLNATKSTGDPARRGAFRGSVSSSRRPCPEET